MATEQLRCDQGTEFFIVFIMNSFKCKQPHVASGSWVGKTLLVHWTLIRRDASSWGHISVLHLQTQFFPQSEPISEKRRYSPVAFIRSPSLSAPRIWSATEEVQLHTEPVSHGSLGPIPPLPLIFYPSFHLASCSGLEWSSAGNASPGG